MSSNDTDNMQLHSSSHCSSFNALYIFFKTLTSQGHRTYNPPLRHNQDHTLQLVASEIRGK